MTHGQYNARPTVTFPAAGHHRPLTGTKLYYFVTEAHVCEQLAWNRETGSQTRDLRSQSPTSWPDHTSDLTSLSASRFAGNLTAAKVSVCPVILRQSRNFFMSAITRAILASKSERNILTEKSSPQTNQQRLYRRSSLHRKNYAYFAFSELHSRRSGLGEYIGWSNITESVVTIRAPFCWYNTA